MSHQEAQELGAFAGMEGRKKIIQVEMAKKIPKTNVNCKSVHPT